MRLSTSLGLDRPNHMHVRKHASKFLTDFKCNKQVKSHLHCFILNTLVNLVTLFIYQQSIEINSIYAMICIFNNIL